MAEWRSSISEADFFWLVGLLEGEGCFHLHKTHGGRYNRAGIFLQMCDRDVVERARDLIKPEANVTTFIQRNEKHATAYRLSVTCRKTTEILEALYPYMGTRRQAKIREILATQTERRAA